MKRKKLFLYSAMVLCIMALSFVKPKQANAGHLYCFGYHWLHCAYGAQNGEDYVIRCDCDEGLKCYAAWQELCNPWPE